MDDVSFVADIDFGMSREIRDKVPYVRVCLLAKITCLLEVGSGLVVDPIAQNVNGLAFVLCQD